MYVGHVVARREAEHLQRHFLRKGGCAGQAGADDFHLVSLVGYVVRAMVRRQREGHRENG